MQARTLKDLANYVDDCLVQLAKAGVVAEQPLARYLRERIQEIARLTDGASVRANMALLINNARVAAEIAAALQ